MKVPKHTLKIIAICLAVGALLMLRRPPRPGDAAITGIEEELLQRDPGKQSPKSEVTREWLSTPKEDFVPSPQGALGRVEDASGVGQVLQSHPAEDATAETVQAAVAAARQVGAQILEVSAPVGVVDARNCVGLNYNQIMRGAVSTRMVWNGHTFVPQKVCVVKEGNSVASVWSFEQSSGAIVSEVPKGLKAPSDPAEK